MSKELLREMDFDLQYPIIEYTSRPKIDMYGGKKPKPTCHKRHEYIPVFGKWVCRHCKREM